MESLQRFTLALAIIGALNWGVAGLFRFDVVAELAGGPTQPVAKLIYIVIGIAGFISFGLLFEGWRNRNRGRIHSPNPKKI